MNFLAPYSLALKIGIALAIAVALGACVLAYNKHERDIGRAEVQQAWDHAQVVAIQARQARLDAARASTDRLQAGVNADRRETNARNQLRDRELTAALERLRHDRPARPEPGREPVPVVAGPGPERRGCTGAELYGDDAAFLTRGADLAQRIREQRDDFRRQYERAQKENARLNAERFTKPQAP